MKAITVALDESVVNTFEEDYIPVKDPDFVDKIIEITNVLCRKYKYLKLKDHDIISDDEIELSLEYYFNGKDQGTITLCLSKNSNERWSARCYLSFKSAKRIPITNLSSFINEFKQQVKRFHVILPIKD